MTYTKLFTPPGVGSETMYVLYNTRSFFLGGTIKTLRFKPCRVNDCLGSIDKTETRKRE